MIRFMLVRGIRSASRGIALILVTTVAAAAQVNSGPSSSLDELIRQRVHYVFVIYQENRSFDHYFGTFPGANGIYSRTAQATASNNTIRCRSITLRRSG